MKIRQKLLIYIITPVIAVVAILTYLSYEKNRGALVSEIEQRAFNMLRAHLWEISSQIQSLESMLSGLVLSLENFQPTSEEQIDALIKDFLKAQPIAFGSTIAFEPDSFSSRVRLFAPYYHRGAEGLTYVDLSSPTYDYPKWDWYRSAVDSKKKHWSEPYVDVSGGEVAMTTCSYPFFRDDKVWGVATVDIALHDLTSDVESIKVGDSGFVFLISKDGKFLTIRSKEWRLKRTISDVAEEFKSADLKKLGEEMMAGESGFRFMWEPLSKDEAWIAYGPVPATGWSMAIVFPEDEMLSGLRVLHRNMVVIALVGAIAIILVVFFISSRISRPIEGLAVSARKIAAGDFSVNPVGSRLSDEVGVLARAFEDMKRSLVAMIEKLHGEKEMFETCFSQMSDGLVILGVAGDVLQFNRSAERLLELPAETKFIEHLAERFTGQIPPESLILRSDIEATFEISRRESEEFGALHLALMVRPVVDSAGSVRQVVVSIRDITAFKSEELSKKSFLSTISHKLITPITVLQSSVALLKDKILGEMTEKQERHVEAMSKQLSKLLGLIEKLIGFVTIDSMQLESSREEIELKTFLGEIINEAGEEHAAKHPEFSVSVAEGVKNLSFNRKYLRLVIGQLIDNAIKFNMNDPAKVSVDCKTDKDSIVIGVTDNGIGIPPECLDRIFEKFFQVEKYFTGNIEGVGLGLSFTKTIVDHFGGKIDVSSTPGKGSVFVVRLPQS